MKASCKNCVDYDICCFCFIVTSKICEFYVKQYKRKGMVITVGEAIKCIGLNGAARYGR